MRWTWRSTEVTVLAALVFAACYSAFRTSPASGQAARKPLDASEATRQSLCRVSECPPSVVHVKVHFWDNSSVHGTGVLLPNRRVLTAAHVVAPKVQGGFLNAQGNGGWTLSPHQLMVPNRVEVVFPGRETGAVAEADETITVDLAQSPAILSDPTLKHFELADKSKSFLLSDGRAWNTLPRGGDLALLTLSRVPKQAIPAKIADRAPEVGHWLTSVGLETPGAIRVHVAKMAGQGEGPGNMNLNNSPYMFFEVQAQRGDSGGPVFNSSGEVVGINSAIGSRIEVNSNVSVVGNYTFFTWNVNERPCTYLGSHSAIQAFLAATR